MTLPEARGRKDLACTADATAYQKAFGAQLREQVVERGEPFAVAGCQLGLGRHQMDMARGNAVDPVMDRRQARQELLDTEGAEGVAALELDNLQGHGGGLGGMNRVGGVLTRRPLTGAVGGNP